MAKLSQAQIVSLARSAGMANPEVMAAIAMAESGGNPNAHNPIPPDNSYGLWQINMLGSMGAARRKEYGIASNEALFNPAVNARAASKILSGQGLKAWSTYTNGAYKKYMGGSSGATQVGLWDDIQDWSQDFMEGEGGDLLGGLSGAGAVDGTVEIAKGAADIAQLGVKTAEWLSNPRNWLNVLYVVMGGVVIIGAVSATVRNQVIGQAKSVIGKVGKG